MTMLTTFAPSARQTVIRAGLLASEGGMTRLSDGYLLVALARTGGASPPLSVMSDKATTDMPGTKGAERP